MNRYVVHKMFQIDCNSAQCAEFSFLRVVFVSSWRSWEWYIPLSGNPESGIWLFWSHLAGRKAACFTKMRGASVSTSELHANFHLQVTCENRFKATTVNSFWSCTIIHACVWLRSYIQFPAVRRSWLNPRSGLGSRRYFAYLYEVSYFLKNIFCGCIRVPISWSQQF